MNTRSSVGARPRNEEERVKHQLLAESNFDEVWRRHSGCRCVTGNEADAAVALVVRLQNGSEERT